MADSQTQPTEQDIQTQHVLEVALSNLSVVIDQLESLDDARVDGVLESLDSGKMALVKLIG